MDHRGDAITVGGGGPKRTRENKERPLEGGGEGER